MYRVQKDISIYKIFLQENMLRNLGKIILTVKLGLARVQVSSYSYAEELLSLSRPSYQREGQAVEKDKQAESLYPAFSQRSSKMGAHWKTERSEPIYK